MAKVELLLPPHPAHVRTARLVGVAAGRRARLADDQVDELRLALGEACARAVALNAAHAPGTRVRVVLRDDFDGQLVVEVHDAGPAADPARLEPDEGVSWDDAGRVDPQMSLALVHGLVDDVSVRRVGEETVVRLSWRAHASDLTRSV